MTEKIKSLFDKLVSLKKTKLEASMKIVYCYGGGLAVMTLLLIGAWLYRWYVDGVPNIPILKEVFTAYTAPAVVAAFTFVSIFAIDKDRDGRPDIAEAKAKEKSGN